MTGPGLPSQGRRADVMSLLPGSFTAILLLSLQLPRSLAFYLLEDSGSMRQGCFTLSVGTYTKDISLTSGPTSCDGVRCPGCFILDTTSGAVQLTLVNCHQDHFYAAWNVDVLASYQFTNTGYTSASVTDGYSTYLLARNGLRGSSMECYCYSMFAVGYLSCDSSITPVSFFNQFASYSKSDMCIEISSDRTLDMTSSDCNHNYCPACFRLDTSSSDVTVTISSCDYYLGMDQSSVAVIVYDFANIGLNLGKVSDGTYVHTLAPKGSGAAAARCTCSAGTLACTAGTVRPVAQTTGVAAFPEMLSVSDQASLGSSLAVRSFAKLGSSVRLHSNRIELSSDSTTYIKYGTAMEFYVGSSRSLSLGAGSGTLHGSWSSDGIVTSSDARLKRHIEPLQETLRRLQQAAGSEEGQPLFWLLAQLRPVSYVHVHDVAGGRRLGFLADDLEQVVPNMVRRDDDEARTQRVYLLDLLAVLVAVAQQQERARLALDTRSMERRSALAARLSRLEREASRLTARADACRADES